MPKRKAKDVDESSNKQKTDAQEDNEVAKRSIKAKVIVTSEDYKAMEKNRNLQQQRLEDCREMLRSDPTMSEEDKAMEAEEFKEAQAELRKADRWLKTREIGIPVVKEVKAKVVKPSKKAKKSSEKTSSKKTSSDKETPVQVSKSKDKTEADKKSSNKHKENSLDTDGPITISEKKSKKQRPTPRPLES